MAIITLTTDLGLKDHYVGSIKGSILSRVPNITIVDISHQIPTYNIQDAAYIVKNAYTSFPKGSIHIIGIKAEQNSQSSHVIVFSDGHYFISADNGIFSFLDTAIEKIIELPATISTFPTRDVFAVVASAMATGSKMEELGISLSFSRPRVSNDNAFAESIFRTLKYHHSYPHRRFRDILSARE